MNDRYLVMRQGIDSLAYLVKTHFELDPFSG
ncbi:IS66-Spn1 transposase [Streptococcus pneumoniae]|nr:IS66-Spn1 transposase [Streptococcus pneumoniae]VIR81049.1 IS66-Spn1 transposase [Streptococcus pneumoniae]VIS75208.1 IS66-Spn1 transposase [Streptococcus pneumoniae]VIY50397.1 IS66-Spn1 transposase [Streptococcus pneumoniae]VJA97406.1 IS66-Spn1 transposase [Streptococcus pneumoniae]